MQYLNEENTVNIAAQAKDNSLSSFTTAASDTNTVSVTVADVTYSFDRDSIQIISKQEVDDLELELDDIDYDLDTDEFIKKYLH